MNRRRLLVCATAFLLVPALAIVVAPPARAYGSTAEWQIGLSFNCNNPSFCGSFLGGFWGWVEFDSDGTGDATLVGCEHMIAAGSPGAGAQFFSAEITGWTIGAGSAPGGSTFLVTGGTMTFSGGTLGLNGVTVPILGSIHLTKPASVRNPFDTGIPAVAGHYDTESFFPPTFTPPPGVAFVIQVVQLK